MYSKSLFVYAFCIFILSNCVILSILANPFDVQDNSINLINEQANSKDPINPINNLIGNTNSSDIDGPKVQSAAAVEVVVEAIKLVIEIINRIIYLRKKCSVIVENHGKHHAHLWCASKDDKIGPYPQGVWIAPGQSLGWAFRRNFWGTTQFWCTMDWYGRRYHWDVYVANWGGEHARWHIRNDAIYNGLSGAKRMDIVS